MLLLSSAIFFFFKVNLFSKKYFRNVINISSSLDSDRADIMSVLIWVQTVCKSLSADDTRGKKLKAKVNIVILQ